MAYGLEIFTAAGGSRLKITDTLTRVRFSFEAGYGAIGSVTVPGPPIEWTKVAIVTKQGLIGRADNVFLGVAHYAYGSGTNTLNYGWFEPADQASTMYIGPTTIEILEYQ